MLRGSAPAGGRAARLTGPFGASAALHLAALAALLVARPSATPPPRPPVYRVNILAAPPGPRQAGVVRPPDAPTPEPPAPQPAPKAPTPAPPAPTPPVPQRPTATPRVPTKAAPAPRTPTRATPVEGTPSGGAAAPSDAPRAGGGPRGDRGTDVATVRTDGIEFPYPGYLNNIVRQIAINFNAPPGSTRSAEVAFTIRRDGSVADVRIVRGSGDYEFDLEARGSVEAAAPRFGPLPAGFNDDALPVVFSFDPNFIR